MFGETNVTGHIVPDRVAGCTADDVPKPNLRLIAGAQMTREPAGNQAFRTVPAPNAAISDSTCSAFIR